MIVFGLVLLILAIVVIAYVWVATAGMSPVSIDYGILNIELAPLWFFFAGGITLAVATSGLWLIGVGTRTSARRAKEMRELRRQARETDQRTDRDRDRTALGSTRGSTPTSGGTSAPGARAPGSPDAGRSDGARTPILPRPGRGETPGTTGPTGDRVDPER